MKRPDRAHYVIDVMLDTITISDSETGTATQLTVLQIWCDPNFPQIAKDPLLRSYMAKMATEHGFPTLIRWDDRKADVIFPPALCADGEWHTVDSPCV